MSPTDQIAKAPVKSQTEAIFLLKYLATITEAMGTDITPEIKSIPINP